jgi:BMFP domain-containing protein YqiC
MDSTKNFFDAWMNTQTKLVGNLMDTSKKLQDSIGKNELVEKSVDLYNNWFEKQKNLFDSLFSNLKQKENQEQAGDFLKDWLETQIKLGQKWINFLSNNPNAEIKSANAATYLDGMKTMYEDWNKVYGQFFKPQNPASGLLDFSNPFKTNFSDLINNTQTYMKMFELWQPIYKITQSNSMGLDAFNKMLDADKYREVLDSIFHFMTPEKSQMFLQQIQAYNELIFGPNYGTQGPLNDAFSQIQKLLPHGIFDKNLGSLANISQQFTEQFHKFINPYFTMIPAGKEKDIAGLVIKVQEHYAKYYIKATEIQNLVYATGQKAIEQAVSKVMQEAQAKAETISFDHFYTVWVDTMETEMIHLFGSDRYSKLLGDLLKHGLELKNKLEKQMEYMLAPLPVVPRSEMDEINATVYELKNKIRVLEQKLKELNTQTPHNELISKASVNTNGHLTPKDTVATTKTVKSQNKKSSKSVK